MTILGLNAFYPGSSAAVLKAGELFAAVEEERLNRVRHWAGVPVRSVAECFKNTDINEVAHVAMSHRRNAHAVRRLLASVRGSGPVTGHDSGKSLLSNGTLEELRLFLPRRAQFHEIEHQRAHMAGAFFPSPFDEATVVSVDGFGDFSSTMWGSGAGSRMRIHGGTLFPHSLGLFCTAFAQHLGFTRFGEEGNLMGLALKGEPRFADKVRQVVRAVGASCRLNLDYFTHHKLGIEMTWVGREPELRRVYSEKMVAAFGPARLSDGEILDKHADLAASVQLVLEEVYFSMLNAIFRRTRHRNLCLAGTVALNSLANGKVTENTPFENVFVHPAPDDAGTSIGAALWVQHQVLGEPRGFVLRHLYYGPEYGEFEIRQLLRGQGLGHVQIREEDLSAHVARELADGKLVGWFQGKAEFGPHSLGNRCVLADPRRADLTETFAGLRSRETLRPMALCVTAEGASAYLESAYRSPFPGMAGRLRREYREALPALGEGVAPVQTVEHDVNPRLWSLISDFGAISGVPVLVNVGLQDEEPAANTPQNALDWFFRTGIDVLVLGRFVVSKPTTAAGDGYSSTTRAANSMGF